MKDVVMAAFAVALVSGCGDGSLQVNLPGGRELPPGAPEDDGGQVVTPLADAGTWQPDGGSDGGTWVPIDPWVRRWFVSPTGSDASEGTSGSPFRTIGKAIANARAGDHILVRAGTYHEVVSISGSVVAGTAAQPIRLQGEGLPKLLLPAGVRTTVLTIAKPYWQVDGFEIDLVDQAAFAAAFTGTVTGSVLSGSRLHGGTAGAGVSCHAEADGASIVGNEIYDFWKDGDDSHGIIVQPTARNITIRGNTLHHNSGDSVQCLGPETYFAAGTAPARNVLIEGNTMYSDREQAVDIKTCHDVTVRNNVMRDYLQSLPGGCAMVVHMSAARVLIEGNAIYNVGKGIAIGGNREGPVPTDVVVRKNRIWNVASGYQLEGIAIRLENSERAQLFNNTIADAAFCAIKAGGGVNGATSNLSIRNNIITVPSGGFAYYLGTEAPGLVASSNLFWPAPAVSVAVTGGRETLSWAAWLASGKDSGSRVADPQVVPDAFVPGPAAVDWGTTIGLPFCGAGPDVGAVETGC